MPTHLVQVASSSQTGSNSYTQAFGGAVTVHDTLVYIIRVGLDVTSMGTITISDSVNGTLGAGNIPSGFPLTDPDGNSLHAYVVPNTAAGTPTLSFSWTGAAASFRPIICEVSTSVTTSVVNASGCQNVTGLGGTGLAGQAVTTSVATLILSICELNNSVVVTDNVAGLANPATWFIEADAGGLGLNVVSSLVAASPGTYNDAWTSSSLNDGNFGAIAIKTGGTTFTYFEMATGPIIAKNTARVAY